MEELTQPMETMEQPQFDVEQQQADIQTMEQGLDTQVVQPLPDEREASLFGTFFKWASKEVTHPKSIHEKPKLTVDDLFVQKTAKDLQDADLSKMDDSQPYQINFDTIHDQDDVKTVIGHMNEVNNIAIQNQRRNVVTDDEMRNLANDLNSDPETIKKVMGLQPGEIVPPEYVVSMFDVLKQSGNRLQELSGKIVLGEATDNEKISFYKQWEFHSQFTSQFMGVRAEYARGFRVFGINMGEGLHLDEAMNRISAGTEDINVMARQIIEARDNKSLTNVVQLQKGMFSKGTDALNELYIASILSGPQTHIVNTIGSGLKTLTMPLDTLVASFIKVGDGGQIVGKGEALAQIKGIIHASSEAWSVARNTLKTGDAYGGVSKMDVDYKKAISAEAFGLQEGSWGAKFADATGKFIRLPLDNLMGAEDAFFKVLAERGKLAQLAYRKAQEKGLEGKEASEFISELMNNPDKNMIMEAKNAGLEATFQQDLGKAGKSIQTARNNVVGARYVMPFVKTPLNIIYEGFVERSPVGLISKKYRNAIQAGGEKAQMAKAKLAIGTSANAVMIGMALSNQITGGYPADKKIRDTWKDQKVQPNSFVVEQEDGTKKYYSFDRLEPYNSFLSLAANMKQVMNLAQLDEHDPNLEKELAKVSAAMAVALAEATVNKTFMKGLSDVMNLFSDPNRYSDSYMQNFISSFVPYSSALRSITKALDPIVKDSNELLDKIRKQTPMMGSELAQQRDNYGDLLKYDHNFVPVFLKQGMEGTKVDKVKAEIERLAEVTKEVAIYKPSKRMGSYKLTPQQYEDYILFATKDKIRGNTMKDTIALYMKKDAYQKATDYQKVNLIKTIRNTYYDYAKAKLGEKYEEIRVKQRQIKEYELRKLSGFSF
jgi:hypothetical protein